MSTNKATLKPGSLKELFDKKTEYERLYRYQIALLFDKIHETDTQGRLHMFFVQHVSIAEKLINEGHAYIKIERNKSLFYPELEFLKIDLEKLQTLWNGMIKISLNWVSSGYEELEIYFYIVPA